MVTMPEYHKILNLFKRNTDAGGCLLYGEWSLPMFQYLANSRWVFAEKVDGMNMRIAIDTANSKLSFFGRTGNAVIPTPLGTHLTHHFSRNKERYFEMFPKGACLYGEGYGLGIQGGGKYGNSQSFVMFDIMIDGKFLYRTEVDRIGKLLSIPVVPIVGYGTLQSAIDLVSGGLKSQWGDFEAEGIVARTETELYDKHGNRAITKIQSRDFCIPN